MVLFQVLALIEPASGLVVAAVVTLLSARHRGCDTLARRVVAAVAVGIALAVLIVWRRWVMWPWFPVSDLGLNGPIDVRMVSSLLPLALALVLVVTLAWPGRKGSGGRATLEPRGILTVTRPWWIAGTAVVLAITTALALAAGLASSPDENGDHMVYRIEPTSEFAGGTTIYGWYFSVPAAIAVAVLLAATIAALAAIAHTPLRAAPEDRVVRLHRGRNVVATTAGALLFLLGEILGSLAGTASLTLMFRADDLGTVTIVGAFAALGPALTVAAYVATGLGFSLWWFVLLAAIRARTTPAPS